MGRIRDKLFGTPRCPGCGGSGPGVSGLCGRCSRATGEKPKNRLRTEKGRKEAQEGK